MLGRLAEYQALLATKESDPVPHNLKVVEELLQEHQASLRDACVGGCVSLCWAYQLCVSGLAALHVGPNSSAC